MKKIKRTRGLYYNSRKHKYGLILDCRFQIWFTSYQQGLKCVEDLISSKIERGKIEEKHRELFTHLLIDYDAYIERKETIGRQRFNENREELLKFITGTTI